VSQQIRWLANMWCDIVGDYIFGHHLFEVTLNGEHCRHFIGNDLGVVLEGFTLDSLCNNMWYQHDGAPAHSSHVVALLAGMFPERWIGRR
jgi:hypothetical protein